MNFTDIGLAFVEGFGLILSPCILPILPIVLSVGITGDKYKPYGIILGFITAFCAFTLLSRQLILALHIDSEWIRHISFFILISFGIILISTTLSEKFALLTQRFATTGEKLSNQASSYQGFFGGILLGFPIGLIWVPCAGPIIAAVVVQTIRAQTGLDSLLNIIAFSIGAGLPMLVIVTQGQRIFQKMTFFKKHSKTIRKCAGVIIVITVLFTAQGMFNVGGPTTASINSESKQENGLTQLYPAPELKGITAWINTAPLTLTQLRGKVVLIDFWTYSCINCVRTLPYLTAWDKKYHQQGLVIIGVHAPEFPFEQKLSNVQEAVARFGIHYPVALDNAFDTWTNFHNNGWPAHYLIDRNGYVVETHIGEGDYATTENNIRRLLGEKPMVALQKDVIPVSMLQTEETYLGMQRAERFSSPESEHGIYHYPQLLSLNEWALQGAWERQAQFITANSANASLKFHFRAKNVYLVLSAPQQQSRVALIKLNGKPIGQFGGKDVHRNLLVVTTDRLYELVNLPEVQSGTLEIIAQQPGLTAYAFTFGS